MLRNRATASEFFLQNLVSLRALLLSKSRIQQMTDADCTDTGIGLRWQMRQDARPTGLAV